MASSIVKSTAQQLGNLLVEETKSLYKVRDKIESLQKELEWIVCFLTDADTQQHQENVIRKCVSEVQDLAYDAEDIVERYLLDVSHHRRDGVRNTLKWYSRILCSCDAWTLRNLGSDIDNLRIKISEHTSRLERYGIKNIRVPTSNMDYNTLIMEERRTYSHTEEDVIGLDEDIQQVVGQLLAINVKVVSISGTGGLGKTTLARKVFKHKDIKDHFNDNCAWVYVSKVFEKGNIFQQILLQLEKDAGAKTKIKDKLKEQLPGDLHKFLQEKRCLVVVDDIWTEEAWESLKPGFESIFATTSCSKILFTTRNQGLLQHVDPSGYLHCLGHLSPEDSWELLKRKAFVGDGRTGGESLTQEQNKTNEVLNEPQDDQAKHEGEMEKLGREMLEHCDGLPIAIIALGGILSGKKTISEWNDVRSNISSYLISGNRILKVLELSYHDLPFYLKPCFLYLGNFPEDYTISTQRLYQLWEAEGFLAIEGLATKKGGSIYDVGEIILNELVQRCMVQVGECWPSGRIKNCRVHDVMRDMCLRKCEEVGFLNYMGCRESDIASTVPAISVEMKKLRRCALNVEKGVFVDKLFEHGERATGLRSLLVFQHQEMPQKVWKCFPLLRVLDLEGSRLQSVDGVGHLLHLRYLSLRNLDFKELPSCLYDLRNLETLDLRREAWRGCMLLCNKFDRMKKLKHLYLPRYFKVEGGEKLKFPNGGQMETIKNFSPGRCETTALMQMTNLRVFSIKRDYRFEKREEVKAVLEAPVMKNEGQLINSFRLRLDLSFYENGIDVWSDLKKLPHLKYLDVRGVLGNKMSLSGGSFPRLTQLILRGQTELEEWEVGEGAFPNLEYLGLECCKLEKWVVGEGALPNLKWLKLIGSNKLEELVIGEGALPILKSLELHQCRKLKLSNLPASLSDVMLDECKLEKWVVGEGAFPNLQWLWLYKCEIGEGPGCLLLALERLPRLKSLTIQKPAAANRLSFSPSSFSQLTQLCLDGVELAIGDGAFPNLQQLELSKLNKLENLPNSLKQVRLNECGIGDSLLAELEKLPCLQKLVICSPGNKLSFSPGSFPQLTQLEIICAYELEEWEVGDGALPHLQHLKLFECSKLKKIPSGLPPSVHIVCWGPYIEGIENYNTCPAYNDRTPAAAANRFKVMSCFR